MINATELAEYETFRSDVLDAIHSLKLPTEKVLDIELKFINFHNTLVQTEANLPAAPAPAPVPTPAPAPAPAPAPTF